MLSDDKRIRIIVGHYGSGKSEIAMNYVTKLRKETDEKIALSDLDVVNVYFRTREQKDFLKSLDIHTIYSSIDAPALDLPAVSSEVIAPITDKSYNYIIDVGGDKVGARVVGMFKNKIREDDYDMFFVINANREQTKTSKDVINHINEIEKTSGLKITGLVSNTHMIRMTTIEDIIKGYKITKEVSNISGIPIKYITCIESMLDEIPSYIDEKILPIKLYMRDKWM